jgi:hypothetical protein
MSSFVFADTPNGKITLSKYEQIFMVDTLTVLERPIAQRKSGQIELSNSL